MNNKLEFNTQKIQGIFKKIGKIKNANVGVDPFYKNIIINFGDTLENFVDIEIFDTINNSILEKQANFKYFYNDFKNLIDTNCNIFKTDNKTYKFYNNDILLNEIEVPYIFSHNIVDLGELQEKITIKIDNKKELKALLKNASKDYSKPVLNGVNLCINNSKLYITTCDYFSIHRLSYNIDTNIKYFNETTPLNVLVYALKFIDKKSNEIQLNIYKKGIKCIIGNIVISSLYFAQDYLKVDDIFRSNSKHIIECNKKALLNYLKQCKELQKINKDSKTIVFNFKEKEVFLYNSKNKDKKYNTINIVNIFEDNNINFNIAFSVDLLEKFLNCIEDNIINLEFEAKLSPLQCTTNQFKGLLMPVKID